LRARRSIIATKAKPDRDFGAQVTESAGEVRVALTRGGKVVHETSVTGQKYPRLLFNLDRQVSRDRLLEAVEREQKHGAGTRFRLLLDVQRDCRAQFEREVYAVRRAVRKLAHLAIREEVVTELLLEESRLWSSSS
jgi:hypothetical protein